MRFGRLHEPLLGVLLVLPAPAAWASVCASGVIVTQLNGTGSGSLYNAFNNNCVEFSTAVANGSNIVSLDNSFTMNHPYTLTLDTAGSPLIYRATQASSVTLSSQAGLVTAPMVFQALDLSGTPALANLILEPSFQPIVAGTGGMAFMIDAATMVTVTSAGNLTGANAVELYGPGATSLPPTLQFGAGMIFAPPLDVVGSGVLDLGIQASTMASGISGSGSLRFTNIGSVTLNGSTGVTLTGAVSIDAGTKVSVIQGLIGTPSQWDVNGTLELDLDSNLSPAITTLAGAGTGAVILGNRTLVVQNGSTAFAGNIQGTGGLTVNGGNQTLSGNNAYSGPTSVAAGAALALSAAGSVPSSVVDDAGTLDISGSGGTASIAGLSGAGLVTLGSKTLLLDQANQTWSGDIQGQAGANLEIGVGTETFAASQSYLGGTTIDAAGQLVLSAGGALPATSQILDNGGLGFVNDTVSIGAPIGGSGTVGVHGGVVTFTANDSYGGATTIDSGSTLALAGSGSVGSSPVTDNGLLDVSAAGAPAVGSLAGSGNVNLGSSASTVLTVRNGQGTLSGDIYGNGGVTIAGGRQVLSGANDYLGPTLIESGATLAFSGPAASIAAPSDLLDDGTLEFDNTNATWSAAIAGSGGVLVNAGNATLSAPDSYSGPTTIQAGSTLALAGLGAIGASAVTDNGLLDVSAASAPAVASLAGSGNVNLGGSASRVLTITNGQGTLSGRLYGSGGLEVAGGVQGLSGPNAYSGTTTVDAGASLRVSAGGTLGGTPLQIAGTLDMSGAGGALDVPTLSGTGQLNLGSNDLNLNSASGDFTGSISGQGAVNLLGGTETLGGSDNAAGGTNVQGGALTLAAGAMLGAGLQVQAPASVAVPSGASIGGDVSNAGKLGVGAGTLRIGGSYTQGSTGSLALVITPTSNSSVQVQGAQLNLGGQLLVQALPGVYLRHSYLLVDAPASTTLNGRFAGLQVLGLSASAYSFALTYVTDPQVILTVTALTPFNPSGSGGGTGTPNQGQLANLLNTVAGGSSGALFDRLSAMLNGGDVATALDQIDGQLYAQTPGWLLQGTREEWDHLFDRLDLGQQADVQPRGQAFAFVDASRGRLLGDGNADGVAMNSSAVTLGRQLRRGPWELGAAAGTLSLGATRNRIGDGMMATLYRLGVFAARPVAGMRLGGLLGYTGGRIGYGMARRDADVLSLQTRLARDFVVLPGNVLTPLLSLDAQRLRLRGATESDPVLGLRVGSQGVTEISSLGALRGVHAWQWRALRGDLSASLGLRHWFRRPPASLNLGFTGIPGLSFTTWGVASPRNMLEAAVGMHARLRRNLSAEFSLQGDYGRGVRAGSVEAHLVWGF